MRFVAKSLLSRAVPTRRRGSSPQRSAQQLLSPALLARPRLVVKFALIVATAAMSLFVSRPPTHINAKDRTRLVLPTFFDNSSWMAPRWYQRRRRWMI
ncbi:MAG: hypothetical protein KDA44_04615 [Planctomycetales bacterium]|nr:hypothetical protein [Planctomycetales bacterium]